MKTILIYDCPLHNIKTKFEHNYTVILDTISSLYNFIHLDCDCYVRIYFDGSYKLSYTNGFLKPDSYIYYSDSRLKHNGYFIINGINFTVNKSSVICQESLDEFSYTIYPYYLNYHLL